MLRRRTTLLHIVKTRMDTGKLEELTLDTLEKGTWLQLTNPTAAELAAVSKAVNVDIDNLRSSSSSAERRLSMSTLTAFDTAASSAAVGFVS